MERLTTRTVYSNRWMTVREDEVRRDDGSTGLYGVVDKPDFVLVVPREENGVWLVEQYRYPVGRRAWEFPQGSWPGEPRGDQTALAKSELTEETGLVAGHLQPLGHLYVAYGFCSQGFDVFLATGLSAGDPHREDTEQDMVHRFVSDRDALTMINTGAIVDAAPRCLYAVETPEI
jgi:8-oxo-dGTP pyrophosphatase MutT (NUDIX family)